MRQSTTPKEPFAADGTDAGTGDELLSGQLQPGGITHPFMTEKRAGCIWGTFIGDALAMPVHWYYDRALLGAGAGRIPPRFRDGLQRGPALKAQLEACER